MAPIPKRIKNSGAFYRQQAKITKEKHNEVIKKTQRVDDMFKLINTQKNCE